jgi:hypothetical protein
MADPGWRGEADESPAYGVIGASRQTRARGRRTLGVAIQPTGETRGAGGIAWGHFGATFGRDVW